ncbi:Arginase, partial [Glycine soja]
LQKELVHSLGGAVATSTLLGVPLGHNSLFREGPSFAPPFIWEGIWCGSANSTTEEGSITPLNFGGDHSILYPVVRAIPENLGGPVDVLRFDAHPDLYDKFEGKYYSRASSFARIMEGGYICSLTLKLGEGVKGVYISIDVDCLDPGYAVGVSHYESGGWSSGRIVPCHGTDPGSIPGWCIIIGSYDENSL